MRDDFIKVLTERPRAGGRYSYHDKRRRGRVDLEEAAHGVEGMRRPYGYDHKEFSDLIGPLYRYLQSRVGEPWNETHSQVCAHLKGRNTVQQHLLDHLYRWVDVNGSPKHRWYALGDFYVDDQGVLRGRQQISWKRQYKERSAARQAEEAADPITKLEHKVDGRTFERQGGIWFEITSKTVRDSRRSGPLMELVFFDRTIWHKRQLAWRELKALGLVNIEKE